MNQLININLITTRSVQQIHAILKLITLLSWTFGFPIYVIMSIHHWITVEGNPIHYILEYT